MPPLWDNTSTLRPFEMSILFGEYMADREQRMVWIDLEMTGLNIDKESIIEIATIITDGELNIIAH